MAPNKSDQPNQPNKPSKDWDSDEALSNLTMERAVHPTESEEDLARRVFLESLPIAALTIAHAAQHSGNERIRLDAAKYIVERNLGKIGDDPDAGGALERLMKELANNDSKPQPAHSPAHTAQPAQPTEEAE